MIVALSDEAEIDLEDIGDYIAEQNPIRAVSFVDEIAERCERLAHMPLRFPLMPRHKHDGIRRMPHGSYLVFYRVGDTRIDILRVLHGAQDYETILFPGDE